MVKESRKNDSHDLCGHLLLHRCDPKYFSITSMLREKARSKTPRRISSSSKVLESRYSSAIGKETIVEHVVDEHDAIGALEIVNTALRSIKKYRHNVFSLDHHSLFVMLSLVPKNTCGLSQPQSL